MAYTVDDVVKRDIETTDAIAAMSARHAEEMAPLQKRQEVLRAWLLDYLNKNKLQNCKTEHGMPYKSSVLSVKIDNENAGWDALLGFIVEAALVRVADVMEAGGPDCEAAAIDAFLATPQLQLINRSVNKTAVKEMMDAQEGKVPPGVKVTTLVNLNVKRA